MAVTLSALSVAGDLTFADLKQYAKDQLQDSSDTKGIRRAERIVNRSLRYCAAEKNWSWLRRRIRILLRPPVSFTDDATMESEAIIVTLGSGSFPSNVTQGSFYFSGDTELMKVAVRDSAQQITMVSNDLYDESVANSNATGVIAYDRYPLPSNFKALWGVMQERDFYKDLFYIDPRDWMYFRQSYTINNTNPIYFTTLLNPITKIYEIVFWPTPNERRTADMWIYVYPPTLSNDSDVADWDPATDFVLYAAIDLLVSIELKDTRKYANAEGAFRKAMVRAKQMDKKQLSDEPMGQGIPRKGNKIQRSYHFVDK